MDRGIYWAGFIVPLALLAIIGIMASGDEPNLTIPINTQVQDYAAAHNISIAKPDSLTNLFSHGVSFGGAGGIADPQIDYINANRFIEELKLNPQLDMIRYTEDRNTDSISKMKRTYYALSSKNQAGMVITDTQWYDAAGYGKSNFKWVDSSLTTITFEKASWYETYWWIIVLIIVWLVLWLCTNL